MVTALKERGGGVWAVLKAAGLRFLSIDGGQRAAALSYSAFFALFPVILLAVSAVSFFMAPADAAAMVVSYVDAYIPAGGGSRALVLETVTRVTSAGGQTGVVALLMLVWVASQFFTTVIQAVNRAWGTAKTDWWKLPAKSLTLLGITAAAVLAGVIIPVAAKFIIAALPSETLLPAAHRLGLFILPWLAVFVCLLFFYKVAPHRRTRYAEVFTAALCATLLLYSAQSLFVMYLKRFASFNAVYGAIGGIMALLLWIYVSGVIFIFCACLSAAQAGARGGRHA